MSNKKNFVFGVIAGMFVMIAFSVLRSAAAFNGPATSSGSGSGAIGVDSSNDVSIGTSTTQSNTKLLLVASSTNDTSNFALKVLDSSLDPLFFIRNDGSISIGTTTENGAGTLTVAGNIYSTSAFGGTVNANNISSGKFGLNTGGGNYSFPGRVGIGTTTPQNSLDVEGGGVTINDLSAAQSYPLAIQNLMKKGDNGNYVGLLLQSADTSNAMQGSLLMFSSSSASGRYLRLGLYDADSGSGWDNVILQGNVGIGTTPGQKLEVAGNVSSSGLCLSGVCNSTWPNNSQWTTSGTAISYNAGNVNVGTNSSALLTIGAGSGKVTAGTFDPAYTINGQGYATYLPGITGEKEETADTVTLTKSMSGDYEAVLDFASAAQGSDLWLWRSVIDPSNNFQYVSVILTPEFDGNVWYTKDATDNQIVIHGTAAGEVSYQLTGRRFDWQKWQNETNESGGLVVPAN